jgi:transcriptional regulator with XRE-family HTH domain
MRKQSEGAQSGTVMVDDRASDRGEAIRRRRLAHGFRSLRDFADRSGLSREAVTNAERGEASEGTYQRLEAFLDAFDHETGNDQQPATIEQMTVTVDSEGVVVTVAGPVSDRAAVEASAANIWRMIRAQQPPSVT